jgi:hypothetical protein
MVLHLLVRSIVSVVIGGYAARYLYTEAFRYLKQEEKILPWPLAGILGFCFGTTLMVIGAGTWIFLNYEENVKNKEKNTKKEDTSIEIESHS